MDRLQVGPQWLGVVVSTQVKVLPMTVLVDPLEDALLVLLKDVLLRNRLLVGLPQLEVMVVASVKEALMKVLIALRQDVPVLDQLPMVQQLIRLMYLPSRNMVWLEVLQMKVVLNLVQAGRSIDSSPQDLMARRLMLADLYPITLRSTKLLQRDTDSLKSVVDLLH